MWLWIGSSVICSTGPSFFVIFRDASSSHAPLFVGSLRGLFWVRFMCHTTPGRLVCKMDENEMVIIAPSGPSTRSSSNSLSSCLWTFDSMVR